MNGVKRMKIQYGNNILSITCELVSASFNDTVIKQRALLFRFKLGQTLQSAGKLRVTFQSIAKIFNSFFCGCLPSGKRMPGCPRYWPNRYKSRTDGEVLVVIK